MTIYGWVILAVIIAIVLIAVGIWFIRSFYRRSSKEIAFVQAGKKAFLDAVSKAGPVVMEPIVDVKVLVPVDYTGNITGDLAAMGGSVTGTQMQDNGFTEIAGQAPLRELQSYHSRLKSNSGGEGSFTMEFSHYKEVGEALRRELTEAYRPTEED